ncbi:hypothetical protein [Intrasporangium flavum]|uniref:hypothetical protein n=1 Tax=Intrasporangium flavum TaxID=1428657 RepID=UPI00096CECA1|nr:hypothetical protein [Intrasporangium flavum]
MALLGVVLLLLGIGAGATAFVAARSTAATLTVTAFGFSRNATALELVAYGAIALLLFALGWALLARSARRRARSRREERDAARLAEVQDTAEADRLEHERRFEEAGLRDDDLRRREDQLAARHEGLDTREAELERREAEWREREGPSRADVVTGRAEGSVADGTARWAEEPGASAGSVPRPPETRTGRRVPTRGDAGGEPGAADPYDTTGDSTTELPATDRGTRA